MKSFLDLLERVAPRLAFYPRWAQALFALAFASVLSSVFIYIAAAPNAQAQLREHLGLNATLAQPDQGQLRAGLVVSSPASAFNSPLRYEEELKGDTAVITPHSAYLDLLQRGGPLIGVPDYVEEWDATDHPPLLEVKLANTSNQPVLAAEVVVDVDVSRPNLEPVPVVLDPGFGETRLLRINNEGWGTGKPAGVQFGFGPYGSRPVRGRERHDVSLPGGLAVGTTINLDSALAAEGVDVGFLRRAGKKPSLADGAAGERRLRAALGRFYENASYSRAACYGRLHYTLPDGRTHTVQFETTTTLFARRVGVTLPITEGSTYAVKLRSSGRHYQEVIPIHEELKPDQQIRFGLSILVDRSSTHSFRIRIRTTDGPELTSSPFQLTIFSPRSRPFRQLVPKLDVQLGPVA